MLASLAVGETQVTGLLEGDDVLRTVAAMRALGAEIIHESRGQWRVAGVGLGALHDPDDVLDMGNSGTAARLLCGILASHDLFAVLTGDASLRRRPMRRVIDPLAGTGARFSARAGDLLPLAIHGTAESLPLSYCLPVASAQVKSALLLAGLNSRGVTEIEEPQLTRDHTENMLRHFGASLRVEAHGAGRIIQLVGQPELTAADVIVPGDPSSAAFPVVAALSIPGSRLTIERVGVNPLRTGLFTTLREMGADLVMANVRDAGGEPLADLIVTASDLHGVDVPAERAPSMIDEYPILAIACAVARGRSRLRGLGELRLKESDRLTAIVNMLRANGVAVIIDEDDLVITGGGVASLGGGVVTTYMDHRVAMSALVLGMAAHQPVTIDDSRFIDTSFPGFIELMNKIGGTIDTWGGNT